MDSDILGVPADQMGQVCLAHAELIHRDGGAVGSASSVLEIAEGLDGNAVERVGSGAPDDQVAFTHRAANIVLPDLVIAEDDPEHERARPAAEPHVQASDGAVEFTAQLTLNDSALERCYLLVRQLNPERPRWVLFRFSPDHECSLSSWVIYLLFWSINQGRAFE